MPRGWLSPYRTSFLIRDYLLEVKEDYPYHVCKEINKKLDIVLGEEKPKYHYPNPLSIAIILRCCEKLNLVKETRRKFSPLRGRKMYRWRKYYKIIKPDAWEWEDPISAWYRSERFWETRTTKEPLITQREAIVDYRKEHMKKMREGYKKLIDTGWKPPGRPKKIE